MSIIFCILSFIMKALIHAKGVVKRYGELSAVAGIDFEIFPGECFGLLGPNGAGKTTTVGMICCTIPLSAGDMDVLGMSVAGHPREIKAEMGICPQEANLDPDFSVRQNLTVYARYFGIPRLQAMERAEGLIRKFHLLEKTGKKIEELSGGLKKRLLIARALINNPRILVLDEPTTGLDPQSRHQIWDEIKELKNSGTTIVLTTHYMEEAALLCDRLVIMDSGRIIERGSPAELIKKHMNDGKGTLEEVFLKLTGRHLRE